MHQRGFGTFAILRLAPRFNALSAGFHVVLQLVTVTNSQSNKLLAKPKKSRLSERTVSIARN